MLGAVLARLTFHGPSDLGEVLAGRKVHPFSFASSWDPSCTATILCESSPETDTDTGLEMTTPETTTTEKKRKLVGGSIFCSFAAIFFARFLNFLSLSLKPGKRRPFRISNGKRSRKRTVKIKSEKMASLCTGPYRDRLLQAAQGLLTGYQDLVRGSDTEADNLPNLIEVSGSGQTKTLTMESVLDFIIQKCSSKCSNKDENSKGIVSDSLFNSASGAYYNEFVGCLVAGVILLVVLVVGILAYKSTSFRDFFTKLGGRCLSFAGNKKVQAVGGYAAKKAARRNRKNDDGVDIEVLASAAESRVNEKVPSPV